MKPTDLTGWNGCKLTEEQQEYRRWFLASTYKECCDMWNASMGSETVNRIDLIVLMRDAVFDLVHPDLTPKEREKLREKAQ